MIESMEDAAAMILPNNQGKQYIDLIEEVFISPIRTAVVVDDEFPTLDEFLSNSKDAANKKHADRAQDIIKFCRTRKPFPWIVDIHDGKNITLSDEKESATHFDHTDLLVLDYHLRGEQHGGDLAVSLLKRLAKNDHFNLVIIYTNNEVSATLREIGLSLCYQDRVAAFMTEFNDKRVEGIYQQWVDEGDVIVQQLMDSLDALAFIKATHFDEISFSETSKIEELSGFYSLLATKTIDYNQQNMLRLFLSLRHSEFKDSMSPVDYGSVLLNENAEADGINDVNWLRVDSLFLTIIKKSEVSPEHFTHRLRAALTSWDPSPHRLIVTKMRSEISKRGVMVEKEILQNPYLQAAWLEGLFDIDAQARRTNVAKSVTKHWDSLGGRVEPEVLSFAEKVCTYLFEENVKAPRFHNSAYSKSPLMALYVNHNVCSKRVEGHHLFTGHVLRIDGELWVCLTPACDLEPGRNIGKGSNREIGDWKPFKAAHIELLPDHRSALSNAARGHHLFLSIDDAAPQAFSFSASGDQSALPTLRWQQFYAGNQGVFEATSTRFQVASSVAKNSQLHFAESTAEVVAQLRYEYALHLLQRLGSHLSRVGLDFISHT
ncbi:response regulator receiver domain [Pseudomonas reinekei]